MPRLCPGDEDVGQARDQHDPRRAATAAAVTKVAETVEDSLTVSTTRMTEAGTASVVHSSPAVPDMGPVQPQRPAVKSKLGPGQVDLAEEAESAAATGNPSTPVPRLCPGDADVGQAPCDPRRVATLKVAETVEASSAALATRTPAAGTGTLEGSVELGQ